jgi:hypothetical protein
MAFLTLINGEPRNVRQPTAEAAQAWLDSWTYSGPDAVKEVVEVPDDYWSDLERMHQRRVAAQMFRHDHPQAIYPESERALVRENCQACCLEGYDSETETFRKTAAGPNVSNWQRDYVQSGRVIPAIWRAAFWSFETSDNTLWAACVRLDIATYGVRFEGDG